MQGKKTTENQKKACCDELTERLSSNFFKALSDPNRALILAHLAGIGSEQKVTEVSCCCPVDVSVVSRHLAILRDAGILEAKKRGREVYYSVQIEKLTSLLRRLADALEACCPPDSFGQRSKEHGSD